MPHVITQPCCNDAACVPVCPVDCIHPRPDEPGFATAEMLYIDPLGCIDCGACVDACPVAAIAPDDELGPKQLPFVQINEDYFVDHPRVGLKPLKEPAFTVPHLGGRRVAVVGAGPAALYTVEELVRHPGITVDVLDRLPTPHGLVRSGVAPDHPSTKDVQKGFARTAAKDTVRFLLNVEVGTDVTVEELQQHYDAVVYAYGASGDRRVGIAGEDLAGCHAATDVVAWYNGHPDAGPGPDLTGTRAVVVGNGNVALDVARILLTDPALLARTDIADTALEALRASNVTEVTLLARRGVAHAACTVGELLALGDLEDVDVLIDPSDLRLDAEHATAQQAGTLDSVVATKLRVATELAARPPRGAPRRLIFRFHGAPLEITGQDGQVRGVSGVRTTVIDGRVHITDEVFDLPADLVVRAVGYRGEGLPGLPFDEVRGVVPNVGGRVLDADGGVAPGRYVSGWIKRGPTGGIGANKTCGIETARAVLEDLVAERVDRAAPGVRDLEDVLRSRGVRIVDKAGWQRIDEAEREAGRDARRPRVKMTSRDTLLRSAT